MASVVDICNQALSHLGADANIAAISPPDGSAEAGYCARFYPIARRAAIEAHNWSFAKTRALLAEVANDSNVWQYAYALPADCIRPIRVLTTQTMWGLGYDIASYPYIDLVTLTDAMFNEQGSAAFEVEGDVVRAHEPVACLLYLRDIENTARFTPLFTSAMGFLLAGYLAGPIIKGTEGAKAAQTLGNIGQEQLLRAAAYDANASHESHHTAAPWMRARA